MGTAEPDMICFNYSRLTVSLLTLAGSYSKSVGNWKLVIWDYHRGKSLFCSDEKIWKLCTFSHRTELLVSQVYNESQWKTLLQCHLIFFLIFSARIWGVPKWWGLWVYCCISCQRNQRLEGEDGDFSRLYYVQIQRRDFPSPYPIWSKSRSVQQQGRWAIQQSCHHPLCWGGWDNI